MARVLVISNYRDYHTSRPEASIFIGLAKLGFEVHIMTYGDSEHVPHFEQAGIRVVDFHPRKKFDKDEILQIRNYLVENRIDIVHLFNGKAIVNGILAAEPLPVKIVLYRGYAGNINWYDPSAYFKYLHPRVDKIFCNSIGVEEHLHKQLFFDRKKTITINKGHNVDWYSGYQPCDIRKELGLAPNTFLLINVSNNRKMKGIPYLLKAFNKIPAGLPVHLLIAGRNMQTKQNIEIIKQGDKSDKIHFLGFRKDVLNIVAASDVFVLPSIKGESITKSVIEAMSLGVAPVITDIPGNRELVIDEESGLVVPVRNVEKLSEAMIRLYFNPPFCKYLGINARCRIQNHINDQQTILKTRDLYHELLRGKESNTFKPQPAFA